MTDTRLTEVFLIQSYYKEWGDDEDNQTLLKEGSFATEELAQARIKALETEEETEARALYEGEFDACRKEVADAIAKRDHALAAHRVLLDAGLASPADVLDIPSVDSEALDTFPDFPKWRHRPENRASVGYSVVRVNLSYGA